ncbi:hypothetical protein [Litorilituus lipolyticus]|uniref:Uncharacterized protein n=1 Tax=Litorilituus lipolyticus TaxID=2491017 RepID=A0A502KW73_9GAMM|nr:hypothetical protein [Litorilituus lipolyticus]TPH15746.1 hypothetical protein EPA86_09245 [Litorilituus lipolyticus]
MNYNDNNNTNLPEDESSAGFVFVLIVIATAYYFFSNSDPEEKPDYVIAAESRIKQLNNTLDYYRSLRTQATNNCETFATKLHNNGHFNVYHSTFHGTNSLWDLNKHYASNRQLTPLRNCSVKQVNFDQKDSANNLLMLCETGGGGWTTNRVLASCAINDEFNVSKINVYSGKSFHIMEGTGTGAPGNFAGRMVSGKVRFEVYKNQFIDYVNGSFLKDLNKRKSMDELISVVNSKINKAEFLAKNG